MKDANKIELNFNTIKEALIHQIDVLRNNEAQLRKSVSSLCGGDYRESTKTSSSGSEEDIVQPTILEQIDNMISTINYYNLEIEKLSQKLTDIVLP